MIGGEYGFGKKGVPWVGGASCSRGDCKELHEQVLEVQLGSDESVGEANPYLSLFGIPTFPYLLWNPYFSLPVKAYKGEFYPF